MRNSPVIPVIVAAATLALVHGCTLPLAGVASDGAGGAASTSATSAGGTPITTGTTTSGGHTTTGATTSAAASSSSTGVVECATKMDCPPDEACATYGCDDGKCVQTPINEGKTIPDDVGDCVKTVCVKGALTKQNDDGDHGDDGDPCTVDACASGEQTHVGGNDGATCGQPGQHCFGGKCLDCADATQCPQGGDSCTVATCNGGMCGLSKVADGASCAGATDCKGAGSCSNGVCSQTEKMNGTACGFGLGRCAGGGCCAYALAACSGASDCCFALQHCDGGDHCSF
jgi:hypothetical protein